MLKLRNYRFCRVSCFLDLLLKGFAFWGWAFIAKIDGPPSDIYVVPICFVYCMWVPIWALWVLRRSEVKAAFAENDSRR